MQSRFHGRAGFVPRVALHLAVPARMPGPADGGTPRRLLALPGLGRAARGPASTTRPSGPPRSCARARGSLCASLGAPLLQSADPVVQLLRLLEGGRAVRARFARILPCFVVLAACTS